MNRRADYIIASTFSSDVGEVRDARYHGGRTKRPIYSFGDDYYTTNPTRPTDLDMKWERHRDQFFAERAGTVLWVAREKQ